MTCLLNIRQDIYLITTYMPRPPTLLPTHIYSRMPPRRSHGLLKTRLIVVTLRNHPLYSHPPHRQHAVHSSRLPPCVKSTESQVSTFHPAPPTTPAIVRNTNSPTPARSRLLARFHSYNGHLNTPGSILHPNSARHLQHVSEPQEPYSLHSLKVRLRIQEHSLSKR